MPNSPSTHRRKEARALAGMVRDAADVSFAQVLSFKEGVLIGWMLKLQNGSKTSLNAVSVTGPVATAWRPLASNGSFCAKIGQQHLL